jgi:hypothetical protein
MSFHVQTVITTYKILFINFLISARGLHVVVSMEEDQV